MRKAATLIALVLALGLLPTATQASTLAVTRTDGVTSGALLSRDFTNGWEFSPTEDILVRALGIYDIDSDGLAQHHDVKLWDLSGSELAGVSLSAGSHPLTSGFAFVDITGLTLTAGETYVISTFITGSGGEKFLTEGTLMSAPEIEVLGDVRRWASGDVFPALTSAAAPVPLGPNFTFDTVAGLETRETASAIPEPFTGTLLLVGLIGLVLRSRRR